MDKLPDIIRLIQKKQMYVSNGDGSGVFGGEWINQQCYAPISIIQVPKDANIFIINTDNKAADQKQSPEIAHPPKKSKRKNNPRKRKSQESVDLDNGEKSDRLGNTKNSTTTSEDDHDLRIKRQKMEHQYTLRNGGSEQKNHRRNNSKVLFREPRHL